MVASFFFEFSGTGNKYDPEQKKEVASYETTSWITTLAKNLTLFQLCRNEGNVCKRSLTWGFLANFTLSHANTSC